MKKIYFLITIYLMLIALIALIHPKVRVVEAKPIVVNIDQYSECLKYK